jgi:hypothetical protein
MKLGFEPSTLIKREDEIHSIQFLPIVMSMILREMLDGCNWILLIFDSAIGSSGTAIAP